MVRPGSNSGLAPFEFRGFWGLYWLRYCMEGTALPPPGMAVKGYIALAMKGYMTRLGCSSLLAPSVGKRLRKMSTTTTANAFHSQFQQYALELDATNEKRERLVKASRDVTINSKKVIFVIHRINDTNREQIVQQAEKDLATVRNSHVSRVARELKGVEYWKLKRAFSPGIQEFVEAATVVEFCKSGKLLTLQQLNNSLSELKDASGSPFSIDVEDYLLGIGDLSGELMRLAVSSAAGGQRENCTGIREFVQSLYEGFCLLFYNVDGGRDMNKKVETMLQSLVKIETTCYSIHVRGSEYPESMIIDDNQDY